jgi:hypothetical protein
VHRIVPPLAVVLGLFRYFSSSQPLDYSSASITSLIAKGPDASTGGEPRWSESAGERAHWKHGEADDADPRMVRSLKGSTGIVW